MTCIGILRVLNKIIGLAVLDLTDEKRERDQRPPVTVGFTTGSTGFGIRKIAIVHHLLLRTLDIFRLEKKDGEQFINPHVHRLGIRFGGERQ